MQPTMVEELTSTPEGMAQFQQERVILDVAMLIRRLLKELRLISPRGLVDARRSSRSCSTAGRT